jgi:PKD domain
VLAVAAALIIFPSLSGADATNPPVVTTDPATGVTNTSATLNGTITPNDPDNGASYTFSWGQTTAYGNTVNGTTSPGASPQSVSMTLNGLAPATTYHYKLCATNAPVPPGGTTCGTDQSFATPDAPTVVAGAATGVTTSGASLAGTVNPNGATVSSTVFKYGTTCSPPAWTTGCASLAASPSPGSGKSPVSVSATLSGLQAGATFHYTLCATNSWGTRCDLTDHTFLTNNPPTATLKENAASPGELQVSFDGSQSTDSDGSIQSWTLNFGDTTSASGSGVPGANIVHMYSSVGSYSASLTVTDDRGATATSSPITVVVPSISVADVSVSEGQTASFVVTLSAVSTHAVTVDYKTADGTAKAPGDYTTTQGTLTIPAGLCGPSSTGCQITVPTGSDTLYENNETFTVTLSKPTGATIADGTATGTILDDDAQPVVMIANNALLEGNSGSTVNTTQSWNAGGSLTLGDASGLSSGPGNSFYVSDPGSTSAAPAGPYVFSGMSGNTITGISPGGVALAGQLVFQPVPLTFMVALCNLADSVSVDQCFQHQITSGRTTIVQFTTDNGVSGNPPHVPVTSGQDYLAKCSVTGATCSGPVSSAITISPGQSTATMTVSVIPNTVQQDPVRWFFLKLVSASNASIGWGLGTGDIIDDDAANPPIASTGNPSAIGTGQATVAATVNPKGEATTAYVQYGTSTSYGKQTAAQTLPADGSDHGLSFNVTGLLPGTTYHYRVVATHDATHATGYGDDKTFTTGSPPPPAPTAKTGLANPVDVHTATIRGVVNPRGTATTAYLQYGKTAAYGLRTVAIDVGAGGVDKSVTFELTRLAAKTTYHYRVVAAHAGATAYGSDITFTTKPVQKPMRVSFASRKPVTVTAKGFVPLALRCTGNVKKRCSGSIFLRFGKRAAGKRSFKLIPNRRTVVLVRLRPSVLSILLSKKSLILGVTITTSDGVESVQILSGSLKILARATQPSAQTASTGSVVQCKTQVYKNGPVYVTSVRNLTCEAAAREQRRYKWTGENTSFLTPGGYRCTPSGRGLVGYQIRCTKGVRVYRIEFAD